MSQPVGPAVAPLRPAINPEPDTKHAYHLYTAMVDEAEVGISRDAFLDGMAKQKIGVGVHYQSVPEHPVYQERPYGEISELLGIPVGTVKSRMHNAVAALKDLLAGVAARSGAEPGRGRAGGAG